MGQSWTAQHVDGGWWCLAGCDSEGPEKMLSPEVPVSRIWWAQDVPEVGLLQRSILSVTTFPHPQCHHPGPSHHNDPPGCFAVASLLVSVFLPSLPLQPSLNPAATVFLSCKANHVSPPENSPIAKAKVLTRTYKALHDRSITLDSTLFLLVQWNKECKLFR